MFPRRIQFTQSPAEVRLFELLQTALPDDFAVLHHVKWLQRRKGRRSPDGEADFVVAGPGFGALVFEVKGGELRYDAEMGKWWRRPKRGGEWERGKDPFQQAQDNL